MSMKMQFNLAGFLKDLEIQFNNEAELQEFMAVTQEVLAPFRLATISGDTMKDIMSRVIEITLKLHEQGKFHCPDGLSFDKLKKNPKVYIDWVGTTSENARRLPHVNPQELFQVVYHGILRYFQMQFDAGGWEVVNDPKTSVVHVKIPHEKWEIGVTFNRKAEKHVH